MHDVLIIGCGIVGAAAAYELSKYNLSVAVVEKLTDIAGETTRANSGLIHAGFDPEPGTDMARLNVRGSELTREICEKLNIPYKQNGALVVGFDEDDKKTIEKLYRHGLKNNVPGLEIISGDKARTLEPRLSETVICALNAPTGAIVSPWDFATAMAETAARNGVKFHLKAEVTSIAKIDKGYRVVTSAGEFTTKTVVNAAGLYADAVHGMYKPPDFKIIPSRGQYYLLDKSAGGTVARTIFQCPNKFGKGIMVTPTVHGNLLIGPSSEAVDNPDDVKTDAQALAHVWDTAAKAVPGLNKRDNIRNFAGVRALSDKDDFIIRETAAGFFDLAGIKSPGLTSAPAIAEDLVKLLEKSGMDWIKKEKFINARTVTRFRYLNGEARAALIKKNPAFGRIVCRCEGITEGEILEAFDSPIPPTTVDAVKRRCHAGMGRCQGGFCAPRIIELIAKTNHISPLEVLKDRAGSFILTGEKGETNYV